MTAAANDALDKATVLAEVCTIVHGSMEQSGRTTLLRCPFDNARLLARELAKQQVRLRSVTRLEAKESTRSTWNIHATLTLTAAQEARMVAATALQLDRDIRAGLADWTNAPQLSAVPDPTGLDMSGPYMQILTRTHHRLLEGKFGDPLPSDPQTDMLTTLILDSAPIRPHEAASPTARGSSVWMVVRNLDWVDVARSIGRDVTVSPGTRAEGEPHRRRSV